MAQNGHLQNRLLAAIPPQAFSLIEPSLRASTFKQGAIVQQVGELVDHVYFPQTGMISLLVVTREGGGIEAASIGREGAVGLHRGLGKRRSFTRAVVQIEGTISHISADVFERAVGRSDPIKNLITHYTEVLWVEAQQTDHFCGLTSMRRLECPDTISICPADALSPIRMGPCCLTRSKR